MSTTTVTRELKDIVSSPRATKALARAGYSTLGDLKDVPVETVAAVPGVGPATLAELEAAWAPDATNPNELTDFDSIEEGPHPIHLSSPYAGLSVRLHEATETRDGRRIRIQLPAFLKFENGEARLTKGHYAKVRFPHDRIAQREFARSEQPWRVEAHEWLTGTMAYKSRRFIILDS